MNLNINYDNKENAIDGYTNISLSSKTYTQELAEIPKCSCDHIIISDAVNRIDPMEVDNMFTQCLEALAYGGKISIQILDFKSLCVSYLSGSLEAGLLTKIISVTSSVIEIDKIFELLMKFKVTPTSQIKDSLGITIHGVKNEVS
jgi:hypothetical protein